MGIHRVCGVLSEWFGRSVLSEWVGRVSVEWGGRSVLSERGGWSVLSEWVGPGEVFVCFESTVA